MFRITQDPSSGGDQLYWTEIAYNGSVDNPVVCVVGVWWHILSLWCVCMLRQVERYTFTQTQTHKKKHTHTHTPQGRNMPPNTHYAYNSMYNWTIISNLSPVQLITPWWWILRDPKHGGVDF
jgi:hypothetical protein